MTTTTVERLTSSVEGQLTFFSSVRASFKNRNNLVMFQPLKNSGREGIEPSPEVLETAVLPLNYRPNFFEPTTRIELVTSSLPWKRSTD